MAPKPTSPLLGYNNNVRHKGRVFHVQTEDSGVRYGHIITQLFVDGGRIIKSVKTSYAEHVGSERRGEIVREMMKQQHKQMFIALRDGQFDALVDGESGASRPPSALGNPLSKPTLPESMTIPTLRTAAFTPAPPANRATTAPPPMQAPPIKAATDPSLQSGVRDYRGTRPITNAGQARPGRKHSVFGDDLTSDKSLDEVILSYLAAELENENK
jgi:hypothetical protein